MFAVQPAGASDVDRRAKRLGDEMANIAVIRRVPMLGLMLDLPHRRLPISTSDTSEWAALLGLYIRVRSQLHAIMLAALRRRVMIFFHLALATPS